MALIRLADVLQAGDVVRSYRRRDIGGSLDDTAALICQVPGGSVDHRVGRG